MKQAHQHPRARGWWQWKKSRGVSAAEATRFEYYLYDKRERGAVEGSADWINLQQPERLLLPPQELWPLLDAAWPEFEKQELMQALSGRQR